MRISSGTKTPDSSNCCTWHSAQYYCNYEEEISETMGLHLRISRSCFSPQCSVCLSVSLSTAPKKTQCLLLLLLLHLLLLSSNKNPNPTDLSHWSRNWTPTFRRAEKEYPLLENEMLVPGEPTFKNTMIFISWKQKNR
jgi:hypothetical protein